MTLLASIMMEVQSLLFLVIPFSEWRPSLSIPMVLYLGLYDSTTTRGAVLSFIIGYLWDLFSGGLMGLYTFLSVGVYVISRIVGVRLFLRGAIFHILITFGVTLLSSGAIVVLIFIFTQKIESFATLISTAIPRAILSAALAPFIFWIMHRIYSLRSLRRREEFTGI